MRVGFTATLCAALIGCALCLASAPAAAQGQRENASEERPTPIDIWISRPREIKLTSEQRDRVEELKTQYVVEFGELGGADEMAVVMQARALQTKYRKLVRDLLTPEQQAVFDENVRAGG
jgi:Spy/CpxP family protein refolding chaperone